MQTSVSGFEVRGEWDEVVDHGERFTDALQDAGLDLEERNGLRNASRPLREALEEWDRWRPKPGEDLETDINEKTARHARLSKGPGERAGKAPREDVQEAGRSLARSFLELNRGLGPALQRVGDSMGYAARAADSVGRKLVRSIETVVYRRIMTQAAPYYFDNEIVSAHIHRTVTQSGEHFIFEVNVNDDQLKERVADSLDPGAYARSRSAA